MRRSLLAAALVAGAFSFTAAPAANACTGLPCDVVNLACDAALGRPCVR